MPNLAEASIGHELTADALVMGFATAVAAYKAARWPETRRRTTLERVGLRPRGKAATSASVPAAIDPRDDERVDAPTIATASARRAIWSGAKVCRAPRDAAAD